MRRRKSLRAGWGEIDSAWPARGVQRLQPRYQGRPDRASGSLVPPAFPEDEHRHRYPMGGASPDDAQHDAADRSREATRRLLQYGARASGMDAVRRDSGHDFPGRRPGSVRSTMRPAPRGELSDPRGVADPREGPNASPAFRFVSIAQPTILRENTSKTIARYRNPDQVGM